MKEYKPRTTPTKRNIYIWCLGIIFCAGLFVFYFGRGGKSGNVSFEKIWSKYPLAKYEAKQYTYPAESKLADLNTFRKENQPFLTGVLSIPFFFPKKINFLHQKKKSKIECVS